MKVFPSFPKPGGDGKLKMGVQLAKRGVAVFADCKRVGMLSMSSEKGYPTNHYQGCHGHGKVMEFLEF